MFPFQYEGTNWAVLSSNFKSFNTITSFLSGTSQNTSKAETLVLMSLSFGTRNTYSISKITKIIMHIFNDNLV
jgi:hypothetical protein